MSCTGDSADRDRQCAGQTKSAPLSVRSGVAERPQRINPYVPCGSRALLRPKRSPIRSASDACAPWIGLLGEGKDGAANGSRRPTAATRTHSLAFTEAGVQESLRHVISRQVGDRPSGDVSNSKACNRLQDTIACQIRTSRVRLCRALRWLSVFSDDYPTSLAMM
jgi:hypothetical protein